MSEASATPATDAVAAASKPAKATDYALSVDPETVGRVQAWLLSRPAGTQEGAASPTNADAYDFPLDAFPDSGMIDGDLLRVGSCEGHTRVAAVETWLDDHAPHAKVIRPRILAQADDAGIVLTFVTVPAGYIGKVDIESTVVTTKTRKRS